MGFFKEMFTPPKTETKEPAEINEEPKEEGVEMPPKEEVTETKNKEDVEVI